MDIRKIRDSPFAGRLRRPTGIVALLEKSVFEILLMYHGKFPGQAPIFLSLDHACNTNNINSLGERMSLRKTAENCFQSRIFLHPVLEQPLEGLLQQPHNPSYAEQARIV